MSEIPALILFTVFVLFLLALDLGILQRHPHKLSFREAAGWYVFWVTLAVLFNLGIYFWRGGQPALEFLTGYVLEVSLSMDNVLVFAVIFAYMGVGGEFQYRVLFWGIVGALIMRAAFIAAGVALVARFHWVLYIFGAFLVVTGVRFFSRPQEKVQPERNPVVRLARRIFPMTPGYQGAAFFVRHEGRRLATPLLLVLLMVETTDVLFAVDSIPAVFSVTLDPFIVYTSNIFAILGLRSLYFVLAGAIRRFRYLRQGLSFILVFVGAKMLAAEFYKIPTLLSLGIISVILLITILASLRSGAPRA
ncbi:MAG: TerC family protein [Acidobacteriia bacterium]|nr:TerC family protein [Terriglobia bacterium]